MNRCKKQLPIGYETKIFVSGLVALVLFLIITGIEVLIGLLIRLWRFVKHES